MAEQLDQTRKLQFSVKRETSEGNVQFILPHWPFGIEQVLPPKIPQPTGGYMQPRDRILLSAPRAESQWASAVGIGIAKLASLAWEIESDIPLRRKRTQEWLLNAGAGYGVFGWIPFISMSLGSYLATALSYIEIERATPANGSKIINIHHLNPLRCRLTGDANKPVNYLSKDGKVRSLRWHQVMVLVDMADPTENEDWSLGFSATERAYNQIIKLAALETYVYEKISGQRPLALYFIGGAIQNQVDNAIETARADATQRGLQSYMGSVVQSVISDVPLSLVTVPLAELPDGFNAAEERERADLVYANAIGLDPQDLNPALVGRQGLGSTGNQSTVLAGKEKGKPLAVYRQQLVHNLNQLALDDKTLFTFQERDLEDQALEASNAKTREETRKMQIETGMVTSEQAVNLAVDDQDLPREFIEEDVTGGEIISDTDKPESSESENDTPTLQNSKVYDIMEEVKEVAKKEWEELY